MNIRYLFQTAILTGLLVIIQSCNSSHEDRQNDFAEAQRLIIDVDTFDTLLFSDFFSDPYFVQLETSENCLFSTAEQILFSDSSILIVPRNPKDCILIFNTDGSFRNRIQNKGRGPGEYSSLVYIDFDRQGNSITSFDNVNRRFFSLNTDGQMVKTIPASGLIGWGIMSDPNQSVIYLDVSAGAVFSPASPGDRSYYHIARFSYERSDLKYYLPLPTENSFGSPNGFYRYNGIVYFKPPFWDTIYSLENQVPIPRYILDFGKHSKPEMLIATKDKADFEEGLKNGDFVFTHWDFKETEDIIYSTHKTNKGKFFLHICEKRTSSSRVYGYLLNDYLGQFYAEPFKSSVKPVGVYKDGLIFLHEPRSILEKLDKALEANGRDYVNELLERNVSLRDMLKTLESTDNPVIAFYPVKK